MERRRRGVDEAHAGTDREDSSRRHKSVAKDSDARHWTPFIANETNDHAMLHPGLMPRAPRATEEARRGSGGGEFWVRDAAREQLVRAPLSPRLHPPGLSRPIPQQSLL
ncbi:unnamed protein product [Lampetra fluviatilis]